ncbi:MAG: methionine--tRNA ligase [Anaerolineae bacterium]|nr:methionine--tRNA ligase [Anaerolineae bacterium]MCB9129761.1 methionine--tRNA ligase [Anaerolineales bacterium]MCB0244183.1 methionine--tRNA ligase [Anaerolineae bacterium]MCB0249206.1 methionine--tRNA ligase [Anaerolineae bacterium]MCB9143648.1 methionine--tRNA ligase [Anaerolineales bacterium]
MTKKIHVCVAWPYAAGDRHIGHLAGAYLPPDIFARYHRLVGNEVLMVSGSDTHGTPITVRAEQDNITPAGVVEYYHGRFVEGFLRFGLTFDLYTHTDTQTHWDVTHDLFLRHLEREYIYRAVQQQLYSIDDDRWLPDRYVEGTCPFCKFESARGDQCDNCGRTYDAIELINPRSKISGSTNIEARPTEHFFLDLGKATDFLIEWLNAPDKADWRPNVINFARAQAESRELRGRPITRDLDWGITIPVAGYADKRIYVWYDAVIGYLSATKEWAALTGSPDAWRAWWREGDASAESFYFIGKDNIPFHAIIWPAMLHGYGPVDDDGWWLKQPTDVPANEYLTLGDFKFSSSFGNVISINEAAERYQVDAWRYALTAMAPETQDSEFTWQEFVRRVNTELVANWGNLVNRVLGFAYKRFDGRVPEPGDLDEIDRAILETVRGGFESVGALYAARKFKAAVDAALRLSQEVNRYVNDKAPWQQVKTDPAAAATTVYVCLQAIDWLKLLFAPVLPLSAQAIHDYLGHDGLLFGRQYTEMVSDARGEHLTLRYDGSGATGTWQAGKLIPGQSLREPKALFIKLDEGVVEEELARMGAR